MITKARWLIPPVLIVAGIYILSISVGAVGDQVVLIGDHHIPYSVAMVIGLLGLGVGVLSILGALTGRKRLV